MFDGLETWQDGKILEYPFFHVFLYQSTAKLSCNLSLIVYNIYSLMPWHFHSGFQFLCLSVLTKYGGKPVTYYAICYLNVSKT